MNWAYAIDRLMERSADPFLPVEYSLGETKYGLSKRSYPQLDIANLTQTQAKKIYHQDFWAPNNLDFIADPDLAAELLSLTAAIGHEQCATCLQRTLQELGVDITVDGRLGLRTISACNEYPNREYLLAAYRLGTIKWCAKLQHSGDVFLRWLIGRILD